MKRIKRKSRLSNTNQSAAGDKVANEIEKTDMDAFQQFSPGYTAEVPAQLRTLSAEVRRLPSYGVRTADRQESRSGLEAMKPNILASAMKLERYISKSFAAALVSERLRQSGIPGHYAEAANSNWPSTESMLADMTVFVDKHKATLIASKAMPEGFPAVLTKQFDDFVAEHRLLQAGKADQIPDTNRTVQASNLLHDLLTEIFADAQAIFRNQPVKRSFYTEANFARTLNPTRPAGMIGHLVDAVTKRPLVGVAVSLPYDDLSTVTDKEGTFRFPRLSGGTYSVSVEDKGYAPVVLTNVAVRPGVTRLLGKISVQPMPGGADPVAPTETTEVNFYRSRFVKAPAENPLSLEETVSITPNPEATDAPATLPVPPAAIIQTDAPTVTPPTPPSPTAAPEAATKKRKATNGIHE